MTNCTREKIRFTSLNRRSIEAEFTGGEITSDGGVLLLSEMDRKMGLTESVAEVIEDNRRKESCRHDVWSMIRQRVYGIGLGYEDLNDHAQLRKDKGIQTSVNRDEELASESTLCRFENRADRKLAFRIHKVFVEKFIASFKEAPEELILDFDATDDQIHGNQEGRFFHGYYDHHCFLPLYVFCMGQLLVAYLRNSKIDGAKHSWAILSLLVKGLREALPEVRIIFRGDAGFCRHRMLNWCEKHDVKYIVGIVGNVRLNSRIEALVEEVEKEHHEEGGHVRSFTDFQYAAGSWNKKRRICQGRGQLVWA